MRPTLASLPPSFTRFRVGSEIALHGKGDYAGAWEAAKLEPMLPSMLLKKLYVAGSLRNRKEGFTFALKNVLGDGHIVEFEGLEVDEKSYPPARVRIGSGPEPLIPATAISKASPLRFPVGIQVDLEVEGEPLPVGLHEIVLRVRTMEVGPLTLNIRDTIS